MSQGCRSGLAVLLLCVPSLAHADVIVDTGAGWIDVRDGGQDIVSGPGIALGLDASAEIRPRISLRWRIATTTITGAARTTAIFVGPSIGLELRPNLIIAAGAGLEAVHLWGAAPADTSRGFAMDLRALYRLTTGPSQALTAGIELTPGLSHENGDYAVVSTFAFTIGYEHL